MSPSDARLGAKLKEVLNYERVVCMLSGADATDTATKIARKWGYKVKGIPIDQAFALTTCACYHGLKISTHSFDVKPDPLFGPYVPQVGFSSPSGVPVRYGDIESLREALEKDHDTIAAFVVEPIQGGAGIVDPPKGYLKAAFDLC
ncbi:hypothetical protein KL929_004198 [Ogataea haglerorum]|nr:hypothetical protein KL931_004442 [Ogataea haglerorum]KAG7795431.1 hypothetical protein KL929_004198 [Ogataea haglerorum]